MALWVKKGAYSVTMGTSELGLVAFACNPLLVETQRQVHHGGLAGKSV